MLPLVDPPRKPLRHSRGSLKKNGLGVASSTQPPRNRWGAPDTNRGTCVVGERHSKGSINEELGRWNGPEVGELLPWMHNAGTTCMRWLFTVGGCDWLFRRVGYAWCSLNTRTHSHTRIHRDSSVISREKLSFAALYQNDTRDGR